MLRHPLLRRGQATFENGSLRAPLPLVSTPSVGAGPRVVLLTKRMWHRDGTPLLRLRPEDVASSSPFSPLTSLSPASTPLLLVLLKLVLS